MANGRLGLVCQKCGAWRTLFKWWGDGAELFRSDQLEAWVTEHMLECHNLPFSMDEQHFRVEGE